MATITKGKLIRDDVALFDGVTRTASRLDATGGTVTGLNFGDEVDVLQVFGSGTSRTITTINDAIGRLGGVNATFAFTTGTWTIDDDLTIPSNVTSRIPAGCIFNVSAGKTLTFQGPVIRDSTTWTSGSGTVVGGARSGFSIDTTTAETAASVTPIDFSYEEGHLKRYGAVGSNATLDNAALASAALVGGEIFIPDGTFLLTGVTFAAAISITMGAAAILKQTSGNNATMFTISTDNFSIEGGTIDFDKANNATQKFIFNFSGAYDFARFYNVHIKNGTDSGIEYVAGEGLVVDSCRFTSNDRGAVSCIAAGADIVKPKITNNYCDFTGIQKADGVFKNRGTVDGAFKIIGSEIIGNTIECDAGSTADALVGIEFPRWSQRCIVANNTIIGGTIGISLGSFAGIDDAADKGPVGVTCVGNTLFDQELEGIELALNATDCVVSGNTIDGNATAIRGILASGSQAAQCKRNLIANNTIRNLDATAGRGIEISSGANEISVIGNTIDIANSVDAIRFTNTSKNNAVKDNTIICDGTGDAGITLDNCAGIDISGNTINDAQVDSVKLISASADTFVDGDVATGTDRITLSDHFHADSQAVTLTSSGTLPGGLALATTYYTKSIDKDTIELYVAADLAVIVDITSAAGGGTHTITRDAVNIRVTGNQSFNAGTGFFRNAGSQVIGIETRVTNNIGVEAQTFTSADATPSVLIGDQFLSNATGVTITQFDDGYAGQEISIISKGATVYDTSTATRLIGSSVDITTASGDVTTWVCETGGTTASVWRLKGFVDVSADNSAGA